MDVRDGQPSPSHKKKVIKRHVLTNRPEQKAIKSQAYRDQNAYLESDVQLPPPESNVETRWVCPQLIDGTHTQARTPNQLLFRLFFFISDENDATIAKTILANCIDR